MEAATSQTKQEEIQSKCSLLLVSGDPPVSIASLQRAQ